ncbi:unnamed protein product [Dovyalis caffra]|uniref:Uncharacterized protein n=1 Tax=Dovyalis caffra TaxID=77055 RepID=A0AAV1RUB1_9ROSI|nr:unnamed protein product [Dovyalis caffra]
MIDFPYISSIISNEACLPNTPVSSTTCTRLVVGVVSGTLRSKDNSNDDEWSSTSKKEEAYLLD